MADLDYTNIAGSSFQPYVDTQIQKRKELVYNELRSPDQLQWLNNKNVWIRVSSGTNVQYGNKSYDGLEGDALSKKYILQGGVLSHPTATEYNLRYGVGADGAYGLKNQSSDPARPGNFGQIPMPGITNISIKTGGKLGTLKETTIDFVCYGMEQLNIMEALYMKLGFSLLVEWGHTFFIDNKTGKIESNVKPLEFYGIHSKEDLMEEITSHRILHSGNYDATWGTVKNFTYTLDGNGAFKCQVQLVGAGDILESLKVNVSGNFGQPSNLNSLQTQMTSSIYPVIADANESLLNGALYAIYSKDVEKSDTQITNYLVDFSEDYQNILDKAFAPLNFLMNNFESNTELQRKGYNFRLINTPGMNSPHTADIDSNVPPINSNGSATNLFARLVVGYEIDGEVISGENDNTKPGLEQVYITLGNLLLLINSLGNLFDRKNDKSDSSTQKPFIYVDINPETNRCYTFPGHCSLDPSICLIGSETLPFGITSDLFDTIKLSFPFWGDNSNAPGIGNADLGGKFMYTLVNLDFIASTMKKFRAGSTKGDVNFVDLVKDILDGISKACGGYNEFRIVPDDDTRCVRIFDDRRTINSKITIPTYTEIPILGTKSIVYNFSYTAKISPNTAAMVVVAAQAIPTGVQGAENALAFSHLNKGLYNRLGAVTVDSATETNASASITDSAESRYTELSSYLESIYNGVGAAPASAPAEPPKTKEGDKTKTLLTNEYLIKQLNSVYSGLITTLNKDPNKSKYTNELQSLNKAIDIINDKLKGDVTGIGVIYSKGDDGKYYVTEKAINYWISKELSNVYESPNNSDNDMEKQWQTYLDSLFVGVGTDL